MSCTCSLEVYSCSSDVIVYTIDADLYQDTTFCKQSLVFMNGAHSNLKSINCESYYASGIVQESLNSHYIEVEFSSESSENREGQFFIALEAAEPATNFSLSCSSIPESWCTETDCGNPKSITNGSITLHSADNTTYGDIANVSCDTGYHTTTDVVTCLPNGTWDSASCSKIDCDVLPDIHNGRAILTQGTSYNAVATYSCNYEYDLVGDTSRRCLETGTWSGLEPACIQEDTQVIACTEDRDRKGTVWSKTLANTIRVKPCSDGSAENITRICKSDGSWELAQYNCIRESVQNVNKIFAKLDTNVTEDDVNEALKQIITVTAQDENTTIEDKLTDGELTVLSSALETLPNILSSSTILITDNIINGFMEAASNLIDNSNKDSWKSLSRTGNGAEMVLTAVDLMGEALTKSLQGSTDAYKFIVQKNLAFEVKKVSNESFIFPDPAILVEEVDVNNRDKEWIHKSRNSIVLQSTTFQDNTVNFVTTAIMYRDIADKLSTAVPTSSEDEDDDTIINGPILALTILPPVTATLDPPVTITFEHDNITLSAPSCVFLKFGNSDSQWNWSNEGCTVTVADKNYTTCECDHLTNFAVLMSPFQEADATSMSLSIISIVAIGVSIVCLLATLGVHFTLWKYLRNDRTTVLMNLCLALLVSYVVFVTGVDRTENKTVCAVIAAFLHYIYLVVFSIMFVEGIHIAVSVIYVFKTKSRLQLMLILAWALPAVIVGISLGASNVEGYGNENSCWLSVDSGLIWAFVGPALVIILLNLLCIFIVMRVMFKTKHMKLKEASEKIKTSLRTLCVLLPIMGVTWILGIAYLNDSFYFVQYIFAVLNGLQGFFIFLFHCLLCAQVKTALKRRERRKSPMNSYNVTELKSSSKEASQSKGTGQAYVASDTL